MKIAQALLLRKQLESKVKQLEPIKQMGDQGLIKTMTKIDSITKKKPHNYEGDRNREIYDLHEKGVSFNQLGKKYDISGQRADKIFKDYKQLIERTKKYEKNRITK